MIHVVFLFFFSVVMSSLYSDFPYNELFFHRSSSFVTICRSQAFHSPFKITMLLEYLVDDELVT